MSHVRTTTEFDCRQCRNEIRVTYHHLQGVPYFIEVRCAKCGFDNRLSSSVNIEPEGE